MTHTPGPWDLNREYNCVEKLSYGLAICPKINGMTKKEAAANARLIAASPMLLDALKKIVAWQECFSLAEGEADLPIISQARAAIAQAEGTN